MATDAQIKSEIARLTATISQHKSATSARQANYQPSRSSTYINPTYRPPTNKYIRPSTVPSAKPPSRAAAPTTQVKEVVLNGVAFESSKRSLVRKDLPKPPPASTAKPIAAPRRFSANPNARVYKPKAPRGRRGGPVNMTLTNSRRPYQSRRLATKRLKYSDKPCPRFTTTGAQLMLLNRSTPDCSRGLTCLYQHDPAKIAICWSFLQGNCPNTAETCNLSHDPTPERTPLCVHFLNKGRCTRNDCPFPHVNIGARQGVCRDFAVLGYCERGLDCDRQHVRECPDFAEHGTCTTKGCKLPHVIRANRNRKPVQEGISAPTKTSATTASLADTSAPRVTAEDAQLGDEFISLTFNESESSEEDDDEDDSEEEGEEEEEEEEENDNENDDRDSPPMETE